MIRVLCLGVLLCGCEVSYRGSVMSQCAAACNERVAYVESREYGFICRCSAPVPDGGPVSKVVGGNP